MVNEDIARQIESAWLNTTDAAAHNNQEGQIEGRTAMTTAIYDLIDLYRDNKLGDIHDTIASLNNNGCVQLLATQLVREIADSEDDYLELEEQLQDQHVEGNTSSDDS